MADIGKITNVLNATAFRPSLTLLAAINRIIKPWFKNRKPTDPAIPSCQKIPTKLKSGGELKSANGSYIKDVNDKENLQFVSVTLDPNHDTPDHLKAFSNKHGFVSDDWWFLTGESSELNSYMLEVFSLSAQEKKESEKVS